MKNVARQLSVVLFIVGFMGAASAQDSVKVLKKDVPESVLTAFRKAYPKAIVKTYSRETREGSICYELESKDGATKRDVIYAANGDVMEIEEAMKRSNLPAVVMATLTKNYPNAKITAAEKLIKGTMVQYESTIKVGSNTIDLLFSDVGELIKPALK